MNEKYISNKVNSLFPVKHSEALERLGKEQKIAAIMNFMNIEIEKANKELSYRVLRMLNLCLQENS